MKVVITFCPDESIIVQKVFQADNTVTMGNVALRKAFLCNLINVKVKCYMSDERNTEKYHFP